MARLSTATLILLSIATSLIGSILIMALLVKVFGTENPFFIFSIYFPLVISLISATTTYAQIIVNRKQEMESRIELENYFQSMEQDHDDSV